MPNLLDALSDSENTIDLQDENLITPIHEFLEINPEKRLITIPESEQLFGVYGENKVEIKYFKCPRIILNDIDLYECYIFINYISASGKVGYIQTDTVVLDETKNYIIFTWELTRNVFDENTDADIYFSISAKQYLEDKEPVFFTRKAKGNLYETVYAEEQITEQYADIILQLLAEMDGVKEIATPEAMQEYVNIWLSENPDKLGGQPIPVKSASEMLNTNTIYLYMGVGETVNEVVYEKGYIYYYLEGEQSWVKGSLYGGEGGGSTDAVQYTAQTLTEEQKTQARENIGVTGTVEISKNPTKENTVLTVNPEAEEFVIYSAEEVDKKVEKLMKQIGDHSKNTIVHVTNTEKETWNNKSNFSGSYNDLSDKPTIPTVPTSLKNPYKLTISLGDSSYTYDGSKAVSITIEDGSEVIY